MPHAVMETGALRRPVGAIPLLIFEFLGRGWEVEHRLLAQPLNPGGFLGVRILAPVGQSHVIELPGQAIMTSGGSRLCSFGGVGV